MQRAFVHYNYSALGLWFPGPTDVQVIAQPTADGFLSRCESAAFAETPAEQPRLTSSVYLGYRRPR